MLGTSLEAAAEGGGRGPAETERQKHREQSVERRMLARGERDEPLESALADIDVASGRGDHSVIVHKEGFGGVGADRNLARDGDRRPVENAAVDLDALGILRIKPLASAQVEKAALEGARPVRKRARPWRKLQVVDSKLVDCSGPLIDQ